MTAAIPARASEGKGSDPVVGRFVRIPVQMVRNPQPVEFPRRTEGPKTVELPAPKISYDIEIVRPVGSENERAMGFGAVPSACRGSPLRESLVERSKEKL